MAQTTDLIHRDRSFDLTRAPSEQWNEEMLKLVAGTVLKGASTRAEQFYCLAVADSLNLNPFIDEIYFIKVKSRDGGGKVLKPYIGRNGLVAKATERGAYYDAAEVHANDEFEVERTQTGRVKMRHKWSPKDRGAIIGAWAMLYGPWGHPAFSYIDIAEYKPTFDEQWKADGSPWYNQEAAMAQKCAMIVAGRQRLQLGNVLGDGEIERVAQQNGQGPALLTETPLAFDFDALPASQEIRDRLRAAVDAANAVQADSWLPAKLEMLAAGRDEAGLIELIQRIEGDAASYVEPEPVDGEIVDAEPVPDPTPEQLERAAALQVRIAGLQERFDACADTDEAEALQQEIDMVGAELAAVGDASQQSLI